MYVREFTKKSTTNGDEIESSMSIIQRCQNVKY